MIKTFYRNLFVRVIDLQNARVIVLRPLVGLFQFSEYYLNLTAAVTGTVYTTSLNFTAKDGTVYSMEWSLGVEFGVGYWSGLESNFGVGNTLVLFIIRYSRTCVKVKKKKKTSD